MKIADIAITPSVMPKTDPTWRFALRASSATAGAIVAITDDAGNVGTGWTGDNLHLGTHHAGLLETLAFLREGLLGRDAFDIEGAMKAMNSLLALNHQAKAGIDIALHDLVARRLEIPLHRLLGGAVRESVPVLRVLSLKSPDDMAGFAANHVAEGYTYLKIKVGGDPRLDRDRVAAVREAAGPDIHLTIDANQSYMVKDAITAIRLMEPYRIDMVEQPVKADDLHGLREVSRTVPVAVEADESAVSARVVFEMLRMRAVDRVSLKIPKLGGIRNTRRVIALCESANVPCRLGAHVGSRILNAAAVHVAVSSAAVDYACELGEYHRLEDDPAKGLDVVDGVLNVPTSNGLGVSLHSAA